MQSRDILVGDCWSPRLLEWYPEAFISHLAGLAYGGLVWFVERLCRQASLDDAPNHSNNHPSPFSSLVQLHHTGGWVPRVSWFSSTITKYYLHMLGAQSLPPRLGINRAAAAPWFGCCPTGALHVPCPSCVAYPGGAGNPDRALSNYIPVPKRHESSIFPNWS